MARGLSGGARIEGLNETVRALQDLGLEVDDLKDAFSPIAKKGAGYASSFAPKDSGNLARSVRGNRAKNKAVITAGGRRAPYAGAINYGYRRRGIEATSFMQRADDRMRPVAYQELQDALGDAVRRKGLG